MYGFLRTPLRYVTPYMRPKPSRYVTRYVTPYMKENNKLGDIMTKKHDGPPAERKKKTNG